MVTLRFLAKGDFLSETAIIHTISKASTSRCVEEVTSSICKRLQNIKLPKGNAEIGAMKDGFYKIGGFPNVVEAVDDTLIHLQRPHDAEHAYVCSINSDLRAGSLTKTVGEIQLRAASEIINRDATLRGRFVCIYTRISTRESNGRIGTVWYNKLNKPSEQLMAFIDNLKKILASLRGRCVETWKNMHKRPK
ncbi:Hypothetical predicted protein [Mytilus galloprovincialis]|uniref:DDE Tnp4 domain-containing protein n=1 Tax=Mytilus galloprovincialis TaxID=29158 RepID=A0A8B6GVF8_MYTGA|nr:Hypothetical predicted protein [Mytilus galloprovincialis]